MEDSFHNVAGMQQPQTRFLTAFLDGQDHAVVDVTERFADETTKVGCVVLGKQGTTLVTLLCPTLCLFCGRGRGDALTVSGRSVRAPLPGLSACKAFFRSATLKMAVVFPPGAPPVQ